MLCQEAASAFHNALTSVHSMQSILLMQLGPHPSPPLQGGGQWQTMMSSSSCCLRLRWLKKFSLISCITAGSLGSACCVCSASGGGVSCADDAA